MITAQVFVDWDSARRVSRPGWTNDENGSVSVRDRTAHIVDAFGELQDRVIRWWEATDRMALKIVGSRIYHGWHAGLTETPDRVAWDAASGILRARTTRRVSFLPDIQFGDALSCGGQRLPLRDTLRTHDGHTTQKMVDTALVSDLLCYSRSESRSYNRPEQPRSVAILIADDDDVLPGAFVAESWGTRTFVLRVTRKSESKHTRTNGMTFTL